MQLEEERGLSPGNNTTNPSCWIHPLRVVYASGLFQTPVKLLDLGYSTCWSGQSRAGFIIELFE